MSDDVEGPGVDELSAPQRSIRRAFEAARGAIERRDGAMEASMRAFETLIRRRIETELRILMPALARVGVAGRDPRRELEMQYVQLRELTRLVLERIPDPKSHGEVLGLVENLGRRLTAHESEMARVYHPAVYSTLTADERRALAGDT